VYKYSHLLTYLQIDVSGSYDTVVTGDMLQLCHVQIISMI